MPCALELRRRDRADLPACGGEAHERRRDVERLEAAGHGVLAADGADAQIDLGHERAKKRGEGLAPALGHIAQAAEVFLEGQVRACAREAGRDELAHAFDDGQIRTRELVRFG